MIFTPENIIENIDKIGGWSLSHLSEIAIKHYYPKEWEELVDEDEINTPSVMAKLCEDWKEIVIKYQKEIGYENFNEHSVNQY